MSSLPISSSLAEIRSKPTSTRISAHTPSYLLHHTCFERVQNSQNLTSILLISRKICARTHRIRFQYSGWREVLQRRGGLSGWYAYQGCVCTEYRTNVPGLKTRRLQYQRRARTRIDNGLWLERISFILFLVKVFGGARVRGRVELREGAGSQPISEILEYCIGETPILLVWEFESMLVY